MEAYLFKAKELLERHEHQIIPFSVNHYKNYESKYAKYFCTYYDLSQKGISQHTVSSKIKAMMNMYFNAEAYKKMKDLCIDIKPDIVQGLGVARNLSYSIFKAAKNMNIPTVMRLSDFSLLCPSTTAMDGWGDICSDYTCSRHNLLKILRRKCIYGSMMATIIGELEFMYKTLIKAYKKHVDYFIAPSRFLQQTFIKYYKLTPERIIYLPIFFDCTNIKCSETDEGYFLYAGRMSREKGVMTLLKAVGKGSRVSLILAGTGPMENELKEYAVKHNLNVRLVGYQDFKDLQILIKNCRAVIVPSECHENSPNIVLEAYAYGKPVIGSHIGGIPEVVFKGETGLTFNAGNEDQLNEKIEQLHANPFSAKTMGKNGRYILEKNFNAENHYQKLMEIYNTLIK